MLTPYKELKTIRLIALAEGWSFVLLLFVAMPLKYFFDMPMWVKILGNVHGLLFVLFLAYSLVVKNKFNWGGKDIILFFISAIVPFGTFVLSTKYFKRRA